MGLADFTNSIVTKDQFSQTFNKFDRSVQTSARGLDKLGGVLSSGGVGMLFGATAGVAGATAIAKVTFELGNLGAQSLVTKDSFESVTASVGKTTALLGQMKAAAGGTIEEMRLMQLANTALAGASGETGAKFAELIPKLIEGARAANKLNPSLGTTEFLFQSLVTGIKRGSPLLIDNTGITLSIADANERLAQSLGKSVSALTEEEKQLALMEETARGVDRILVQAGGNLDTMATSADKLKVAFQELKVAIGEALAPATSGAQETLASWLTLGADALSSDAISRTRGELEGLRIVLATLNSTPVDPGSVLGGGAAFFSDADKQNAINQALESIKRLEAELASLTVEHNKTAYAANTGATAFSGYGTAATVAANQIGALTFSLRQAKEAALGLGGSMAGLSSEYKAGLNSAFGQIFGMGSAIPAADASAMYGDYTRQYAQLELDRSNITRQEYARRKADLDNALAAQLASYRKFASDAANIESDAIESIKSKIGSALTPTFDLGGLTGGMLGGGGDTFDEAYKRLAAVALRPEELQIHSGDWGDTFAKAGLTGLSPEDAQKRARELVEAYSKGLDFSLIDREKIKDSVRQAIKAEELYNSIVDEIYAEMGKEKPKLAAAGTNIGNQLNKAATDTVKSGAKDYISAWVGVLTPEIIKAIDARNRRTGELQ